jgi:heme exporter protein D
MTNISSIAFIILIINPVKTTTQIANSAQQQKEDNG